MANQLSSHLYDLIYSLSSSERRYFKLYIKNHLGKQNDLSVKLFDLIARNEGKPIEKVEKKITFTKHPSRLKNYLYDLILKSLESYHSKTSVAIKIRKQINQIENLYNKALYDQCASLAKKALKEAEKIDNQNFKIDIITWHLNALKQVENSKSSNTIAKLQTLQQEAINKLKLEKEFNKLSQSVYDLTKKLGTLHTQENEDKLKELIDNPFLSDYSMATSFSSKSSYNSIFSGYYSFLGDIKKMSFFSRQNLMLYEDYPARKNSDQFNYVTQLNNYALSCSQLKDYEKADYYFSKMASIEPNTIQIEVKIFEFIAANRLDLYLRSGDLKQALKAVVDTEEGLKKYGKKVSDLFKTVMYSNLCYLFLATKTFKKALAYNNLILNSKNVSYRSDIFRFARIMNLLIHYEMGDKLSIEYFYDATKRFISKQNNIYVFEDWFLSFFKELISKKQAPHFFKEKELELLNILKDKKERKVISHFNILAWLRTKHESLSFEDVAQEYSVKNYSEYSTSRMRK